jgi:ABC-type polar amino acid transport system ATPase subunit
MSVKRELIVIRIDGLKKNFHKNEVLRGIDAYVDRGEVVGVIGPSGSGKSTFLRCLNFLETPDTGCLTFDNEMFDMARLPKRDMLIIRRRTAMVFQQFNLFKYKTALENVMEGQVVVKKIPPAEAKERSEFFLKKVGLSDRMMFYPSQLSGGQQQRVAIARAMALRPEIILFDEPTSALDPEMVSEVLKTIKDAAKDGNTLIIVSHEMNFIYEIADRVLFMDNGVILEEGSPHKIFGAPKNERVKEFISRVSPLSDYTI